MERSKFRIAVAAVAAVTAIAVIPAQAAAGKLSADPTGSGVARGKPGLDSSSALVQLAGVPLAANGKLNYGQDKRLDLTGAKTKSARAQLAAIRNDFKRWLQKAAPATRVTSEFDIAINAVAVELNGASVDILRGGPGVVSAALQQQYTLDAIADPDLALVDAVAGWGAGGAAGAGAGVKVAVIDSGIDVNHPCFAGTPGNAPYTNSKVIVAKVFNMRAKVRGYDAAPGPGQDHGTHVAGTIACNYQTPTAVGTQAIPYAMSGVAPAALLGNYNVFPGDVESARSEDILNALQAAYLDGMDVANMSLGGGSQGAHDLLTHAVDVLDAAGMVIAISAGNEGPGPFTIGSPGMAERALTAGAYSVGHFIGIPVTVGSSTLNAAAGDFPVPTSLLTANLAVVMNGSNIGNGCSAVPGVTAGSIAVIARGSCTFSQKVYNAQQSGAAAVLVVNNAAGVPTAMATDPAFPTSIPALMVSLSDGTLLKAANGQSATIGVGANYVRDPLLDRIMAGFSSMGPTDVDFRVKPDVVAPGGNVLSSVLGNGFAFFSGTSMASPHLAGLAAVVVGKNRDWSPVEVRSAIVNTASRAGLRDRLGNGTTNPLIIGNGAATLTAALAAKVALDPVSTSFGAVPVGNGNTWTRSIQMSTLAGSGAITCAVDGVGYGCDVQGNRIIVSYTPRAAGGGDNPGSLTVLQGGVPVATSVLFAWGK